MPGHDAKTPKPAPTNTNDGPAAIPAGTPTAERFAAETAHHDVPGSAPEPAVDPNETVSMDSPARHERVRLKAYELWEQEGRPDGRAEAHWAEAERLIEP